MVDPTRSVRENARQTIQKAAGRMTRRYVVALALIALLSVTGFSATRMIIQKQDQSSTVLNVSGHERMLVQQIASAALHMIAAEDGRTRSAASIKLARAVNELQSTHRALISGDERLGLSPETRAELNAMYFEPPLELSSMISGFLLDAARLISIPEPDLTLDHPVVREVLRTANGPLLEGLQRAAGRYEAAAKEQVEDLRRIELAILQLTLLLLILVALFIFRPLVQRIRLEANRFLESQDALERMAHHDELTGLPNRVLFQLRLEMALAQARRDGTLTAVLQLDLDHFKDINDTLGHPAGDHLLCEVARRLERALRDTDTVARLGGDEFALILTGLHGPHQVGPVAEKIVEAIGRPIHHDDRTIHTSASVGITLFPADDEDPEQLLKNADIALYQAKAEGRNTFAFFISDMKTRVERRAQIEQDLRRALSANQFELHYQPQVRVADRSIIGFEALLRWHHPERGLIAPPSFLPVAEETGLIVPIGISILERAVGQLRMLDDAGLTSLRLAINLAGAQLRAPGFIETFDSILSDLGVAPERLEIEITEGVMLGRGQERIAVVLDELRRRGVTIALDDFGTGHASLTHLKRIKVHRLKIDRSFVRDIGADPEDAAIVRAVTNLGHSLAVDVVAEGVEHEEQLDFLRLHGCDFAQGYLFGRPMPADELLAHLRARSRPGREALEPALG